MRQQYSKFFNVSSKVDRTTRSRQPTATVSKDLGIACFYTYTYDQEAAMIFDNRLFSLNLKHGGSL